jgi:hypothetical protein
VVLLAHNDLGRLVRVGRRVQRAHGCWRSRGGVHGSVVSPASVGQRCCSLRSFRYLSPWQRSVRRWKWRGPHAERPGLVVFIGTSTGVLH